MGGAQPFFEYDDVRFPGTVFDPKAVTRASWEPKPRKPQPSGPLVSFNRHPDAHPPPSYQPHRGSPLGPRSRACIKRLRQSQLMLRLLQLNGAAGALTLMVLFTGVDTATAWVLRIAPGLCVAHCLYAVYHLSRGASGRPPASSAAYQLFAAVADVGVVSVYAFGAVAARQQAGSWGTRLSARLSSERLLADLALAVYCIFLGAGALHLVSLSVSLWLAFVFRKISLMPPDMNPLRDRLTARPPHARSKSTITMASSLADDDAEPPCHDAPRPPSIPFMHTRARASLSPASLPDRHRHVTVPRHSPPNTACPASAEGHGRPARFTETWLPTDSLISRTNLRNRSAATTKAPAAQSYSALPQHYAADDSSGSEYESEPGSLYPDPLRSHPTPPSCPTTSSSVRSGGSRRDEAGLPLGRRVPSWQTLRNSNPYTQHDDDDDDGDDFCPRPCGPLGLYYATPTVMVGNGRKVSSGNDYQSRYDSPMSSAYGRRTVSGRQAEERRAAGRLPQPSLGMPE